MLFACILGCHACQSAKPVSPPTAEKGIATITGRVRLRDGIKLPPNAALRITVRWYDDLIASETCANVSQWPAMFAIKVKWPIGKGDPTVAVHVSAWADVDGQAVLLSGGQTCLYRELGTPMEFVLIPVRE